MQDLNAQPGASDAAEQQQWEALEKEVSDEALQEAPAEEAAPALKSEPEKADDDQAEKPLAPEVLTERYRQLQGALKEEREQRKAERDRAANMEKLFQQIIAERKSPAAAQNAAPAEPQIPSIEDDPIGHFQAKTALLERQLQQVMGASKQTAETFQQTQQEQAFWVSVGQAENQFKAATPDYDDAVKHLETARVQELAIMYPDDAPGAIKMAQDNGMRSVAELREAILNRDRRSVAEQGITLGVNPAQLYYNLAKQRGWSGKQPTSAAPNPQIAAAKAGQRATNAMSSGATRAGTMTAEDIAELYLTDPDRADKEFQRMMGAV